MKFIRKSLGKTKNFLRLLLVLWIFLQSCGCDYNNYSNADAAYEVTKNPEFVTPETSSSSQTEMIVADEKTDYQVILAALQTAGYSETASTDAEQFLNVWKEAKNRKHLSPALKEVPISTAQIVPFQARMQFPGNHAAFSVLITSQLQEEYLISIWDPGDKESPFEVQYLNSLFYVRHPIEIDENEADYEDFLALYESPESVELIADALSNSRLAAADPKYASVYYETLLTGFFCNGMEPAPLKSARLTDLPQEWKGSPGFLIPAAVEVVDAKDNVIQIILSNPKFFSAEGMSAVTYNSELIFWRSVRKD